MAGESNRTVGSQRVDNAAWKAIVAKYQHPSTWRALWQIIDTLIPYAGLWYLIYLCRPISWWLVVPLAILAGGLVVRVFIIFHDCGHGSFFKSRVANDTVGFIAGILTFTPYYHWRWEHAIHHSSAGHLDKRGTGDIWTMTVQEYLESSRWKRSSYRLSRNPIVLFIIAPVFLLLIRQRFASPKASQREAHSVYLMNAALVGMAVGLSWAFGFWHYLLIQLIILMVAGGAGVWLFYVQHQFEGVYWERSEDWNYVAAALQGSSFYRLPRLLQWFSGNIGFHHIHHLSPRIPNYNLEKCHRADPLFQQIKPITFFSSVKSLKFRLWDEPRKQLVGYKRMREIRKQHEKSPPKTDQKS
jgi:omega-6 fatty acid desaturase (delta-12 desaturase)